MTFSLIFLLLERFDVPVVSLVFSTRFETLLLLSGSKQEKKKKKGKKDAPVFASAEEVGSYRVYILRYSTTKNL